MWIDFLFDKFHSEFILEIEMHTDCTHKGKNLFENEFWHCHKWFFYLLFTFFSFLCGWRSHFSPSKNTSEIEIQILDTTWYINIHFHSISEINFMYKMTVNLISLIYTRKKCQLTPSLKVY